MSHHKDGVIGRRVGQSAGSIQEGVHEVVEVINRFVQFSVRFLKAFQSISAISNNRFHKSQSNFMIHFTNGEAET